MTYIQHSQSGMNHILGRFLKNHKIKLANPKSFQKNPKVNETEEAQLRYND